MLVVIYIHILYVNMPMRWNIQGMIHDCIAVVNFPPPTHCTTATSLYRRRLANSLARGRRATFQPFRTIGTQTLAKVMTPKSGEKSPEAG